MKALLITLAFLAISFTSNAQICEIREFDRDDFHFNVVEFDGDKGNEFLLVSRKGVRQKGLQVAQGPVTIKNVKVLCSGKVLQVFYIDHKSAKKEFFGKVDGLWTRLGDETPAFQDERPRYNNEGERVTTSNFRGRYSIGIGGFSPGPASTHPCIRR